MGHRRVVLVVGLPSQRLLAEVWQQARDDQTLQIFWDTQLPVPDILPPDEWDHNAENPELRRMHQLIHGVRSGDAFRSIPKKFFSVPYPGPPEYLAQFGEASVLLCDTLLMPFYAPMWVPFATDITEVRVSQQTAAEYIRDHPAARGVSPERVEQTVRVMDERLTEALDGRERRIITA